jgi:hypothetical protein
MMEVHAESRERASVSAAGQTAVQGDPDRTTLCLDDCEPCEYEIRQRAYEISLTRPGAPPDSQSDWLQAQTELLGRRILGLT